MNWLQETKKAAKSIIIISRGGHMNWTPRTTADGLLVYARWWFEFLKTIYLPLFDGFCVDYDE